MIGNEIKNEVDCAPYILIQADETTDCAMRTQLSRILRYVNKSHICERFLGFFEVSEDKSSSKLTEVISSVLNTYSNSKEKLVSQTYDGAAVMAGKINGVQRKLKDNGYTHAHSLLLRSQT